VFIKDQLQISIGVRLGRKKLFPLLNQLLLSYLQIKVCWVAFWLLLTILG